MKFDPATASEVDRRSAPAFDPESATEIDRESAKAFDPGSAQPVEPRRGTLRAVRPFVPQGLAPSNVEGGRGAVTPPAAPSSATGDPIGLSPEWGAFDQPPPAARASVLDEPTRTDLSFAEASRSQRQLDDRIAAAREQQRTGTVSPATKAQSLAMDVAGSTTNPVARGAVAGFAGLGKVGIGAMRLAADLGGLDGMERLGRGAAELAGGVERGAMDGLGGNEKLVADVTSSIMNSLPSMALGVAGGPALRGLFVQSTLQEYNAGRDAGFDTGESLARAGIMGTAEALGERFGFPEQIKLLKSITQTLPAGELARAVGGLLKKEIPGEQLTTAIQFMADKAGPAALAPNATLEDYLNAAGETLKVTIGQMAVMGGGPAALVATRNELARADAVSAMTPYQRAREVGFHVEPPLTTDAPQVQRRKTEEVFTGIAAMYGLPAKIVQAARQAAEGRPLRDLGGFYSRFIAALQKRGAAPADIAPEALEALAYGPVAPVEPGSQEPPRVEERAVLPQAVTPTIAVEVEAEAIDSPATSPAPAPVTATDGDIRWFAPESGTLGVPREDMPQIAAEHRGALIRFLNARGVSHESDVVEPGGLRPTQATFNERTVREMATRPAGGRSVLVSADGHILDGHHQSLAAHFSERPIKVIRLNAPISDLLPLAREFPSSTSFRFPRIDSVDGIEAGPRGRIEPTPLAPGGLLYRETNLDGITDLLRDEDKARLRTMAVVDHRASTAQGSDRRIVVTFRPDSLSGHEQVGTAASASSRREFQTDILAPRAIQSIEMDRDDVHRLSNGAYTALSDFERTELGDGRRVRFDRNGLAADEGVDAGRLAALEALRVHLVADGSFTLGLRQHGGRIHLEDRRDLMSRAAELRKSGARASEAALRATEERLEKLRAKQSQQEHLPAPGREEQPVEHRSFTRSAATKDTPEPRSFPSQLAGLPERQGTSLGMSPELAQRISEIRVPATPDSVRAAVRELVNGIGLMPNSLGRVVVATSDEIKREWQPLIGQVRLESEQAGDAMGFYDPKSKTVFLIADRIPAGQEKAVAAHELVHKHGRAVLGAEGWNKLHGAISAWAQAAEGSVERQVHDAAVAAVSASAPEGADTAAYSSEELFPYAVQAAIEMGVKPNLLAKQGTVERWLADVRRALRELWKKVFGKAKAELGAQDLVNLAFAIAQRENPAHRGELDAALRQQTESAEFKRWFGDSKVVDAEGKPLVVYHGTRADFDAFKPGTGWFEADPGAANFWGGMNGDGARVVPAFLSIKKPLEMPAAEVSTSRVMDALTRGDIDGVIVREDGKIRWAIVQDPQQIKSATGNRGTFDPSNPDIRYSFAGPFSRTADIHSLAVAQERLASGSSADDVRQDTGWFKGTDGKWRYEINDADAKLLRVPQGEAPLGEVLDHPALFAAYPGLAAMPTKIEVEDGKPAKGKLTRSTGAMEVSAPTKAQALSILLHEVQHGIQGLEGFARGGGRSEFARDLPDGGFDNGFQSYFRLAGEVEARNTQTRQALDDNARLAIAPDLTADVAAGDVIVRFNGEDAQSAPPPANAGTGRGGGRGNVSEPGDADSSGDGRDTGSRIARTLAHWRGVSLQVLGRRQLLELYENDLPQLRAYGDLVQQMDAYRNDAGAKADEIARAWAKVKDDRALANLMHDATLEGVDPSLEDARGPLRGNFKLLSKEAQAIFVQARDAYLEHFAHVERALADRIRRADMSSERRQRLLAKLADNFRELTEGVYFPLARFGDYLVIVRNAQGEAISVSRAETLNEADELRKSLLRQFKGDAEFTVGKVLKDREYSPRSEGVSPGFLAELYEALEKEGVSADLMDNIGQLYLSSLPDLSWAKHSIHRKKTPGFSQDARRAFAAYMSHGASYVAKLRYADQLQSQLEEMQQHVDGAADDKAFDSVRAQQVVDEMVKRHELLMNQKAHPISTALTSIGFVFHLGLSPASAMVNLTQTPLVAYPLAGAKWGYARASAELTKAMTSLATHGGSIEKGLRGDEVEAYREAVRVGLIDVTMAHDLAGVAAGEDAKVHAKLRPVMRAASWMFHHAERWNREVTFIAGYRLARKAGADAQKAFDDAVRFTYDSHFDYGASNRPRIMQGNWQRVIFLFKQFAQNMIFTIARQAQQSLKGATPETRSQARKALAGLLATHAAAAGVLGLPLVGTLLKAASMIGGDDDEPWDAETALRNLLADTFGQKAAEVLARGLSRLTPWDISGRVGLDRLILPDVWEGLEGQRAVEAWFASALGPVAGIAVNTGKGLQDIAKGHWLLGLESMMPSALRGPLRAFRLATEGAQDRSGVPILDEISNAAIVGQVLGLSPSELRNAQEGRAAVFELDRALTQRRRQLLGDYARAEMSDNDKAIDKVIDALDRWNEKQPDREITMDHMDRSVEARENRIEGAEGGVYLPGNRDDALEAGRFARNPKQ
jgi:Large polyvalent protein associated domain 39/Large polyvalent protein associated domain 23/ADP-Ribosyltransferase in polyvalent proteins